MLRKTTSIWQNILLLLATPKSFPYFLLPWRKNILAYFFLSPFTYRIITLVRVPLKSVIHYASLPGSLLQSNTWETIPEWKWRWTVPCVKYTHLRQIKFSLLWSSFIAKAFFSEKTIRRLIAVISTNLSALLDIKLFHWRNGYCSVMQGASAIKWILFSAKQAYQISDKTQTQ